MIHVENVYTLSSASPFLKPIRLTSANSALELILTLFLPLPEAEFSASARIINDPSAVDLSTNPKLLALD